MEPEKAKDFDALLARVFRKETLTEKEITGVCEFVKEILKRESNMQFVRAPVVLVGDIHGQYKDLLRLFEECGWPADVHYLFLGDYVDRGPSGLEVRFFLLFFLWVSRNRRRCSCCSATRRSTGTRFSCCGGTTSAAPRPLPPAGASTMAAA